MGRDFPPQITTRPQDFIIAFGKSRSKRYNHVVEQCRVMVEQEGSSVVAYEVEGEGPLEQHVIHLTNPHQAASIWDQVRRWKSASMTIDGRRADLKVPRKAGARHVNSWKESYEAYKRLLEEFIVSLDQELTWRIWLINAVFFAGLLGILLGIILPGNTIVGENKWIIMLAGVLTSSLASFPLKDIFRLRRAKLLADFKMNRIRDLEVKGVDPQEPQAQALFKEIDDILKELLGG